MAFGLLLYGHDKLRPSVLAVGYYAEDVMARFKASGGMVVQLVTRVRTLSEALRRAHACATLRDDGTCGGCFVSEALIV